MKDISLTILNEISRNFLWFKKKKTTDSTVLRILKNDCMFIWQTDFNEMITEEYKTSVIKAVEKNWKTILEIGRKEYRKWIYDYFDNDDGKPNKYGEEKFVEMLEPFQILTNYILIGNEKKYVGLLLEVTSDELFEKMYRRSLFITFDKNLEIKENKFMVYKY